MKSTKSHSFAVLFRLFLLLAVGLSAVPGRSLGKSTASTGDESTKAESSHADEDFTEPDDQGGEFQSKFKEDSDDTYEEDSASSDDQMESKFTDDRDEDDQDGGQPDLQPDEDP